MPRPSVVALVVALGVVVVLPGGCSSPGASPVPTAPVSPASPASPATAAPTISPAADAVFVGASSRSILPTVGGNRDYVSDAPGWSNLDPFDPGVFVAKFDQGRVDVGGGNSDAAWVHDDLKATAVAIRQGASLIVLVTVDVYMILATENAAIEARARQGLPEQWRDSAEIIVAATHDREGPDSGFRINDAWSTGMADETAATIEEAVSYLEPATIEVAHGEHRFGVDDTRDPIVIDPALRVMVATSVATSDVIATIVQWTSDPATTLGFEPAKGHDISADCAAKGWTGDMCYAAGRYFTADYPGVLRDVVSSEIGGEVMYFNGALGRQIGPGEAPVWLVDATHPVGNGWTVPGGAAPVPGAADLFDENFSRTLAIGTQLAQDVLQLVGRATPLVVGSLGWKEQPFSTRIRVGDVLQTRLVHVTVGDVGFLFMPGELPPEAVIGLPADFATNTAKYYRSAPEVHADDAIPGYLLHLVHDSSTFTIGFGGDELGQPPANDAETNSAGRDLVADTWAAAVTLFGTGDTTQVNPDNPGYTPGYPPPNS